MDSKLRPKSFDLLSQPKSNVIWRKAVQGLMSLARADKAASMEWECRLRLLVSRCEQQLGVHKSINQLSPNVNFCARDALRTLEGRIRMLRSSVRAEADASADSRIDSMSAARDHVALGLRRCFKTCVRCGNHIFRSAVAGHDAVCKGVQHRDDYDEAEEESLFHGSHSQCRCCGSLVPASAVKLHEVECRRRCRRAAYEARSATSGVVTVPRRPRDVRVAGIGPTSIELEWESPILDGGAQITDFEVSYRLNGVEMRQTTTSFCFREPVANHGAVLQELRGATNYSEVRVRCLNAKGWSGWSEALLSIRTKQCVPPSPPLFVRPTQPSSQAFGLTWLAPISDGGASIVDYIVSCTQIRHLSETEYLAEGLPQHGRQKPPCDVRTSIEIRTHSSACGCVLDELRGGADYIDIRVRAISSAKLESRQSEKTSNVTTKQPSQTEKILTELKRARASDEPYIDSAFYQTYVQRESRADYVQRLELELQEVSRLELPEQFPPDLERLTKELAALSQSMPDTDDKNPLQASTRERVENTAAPATKSRRAADEELPLDTVPEYRLTARQYKHRIDVLSNDIDAAEKTRWQCFGDRAALTRKMAAEQARLLAVRAEVDRVAHLKVGHVNSSVMHGSEQRFSKPQLQRELQREMEKCLSVIAHAKRDVRRLDEIRERALRASERKRAELADRRAALQHVKTLFGRRADLLERQRQQCAQSQPRREGQLSTWYFRTWRDRTNSRRQLRATITALLAAYRRKWIRAALERWRRTRRPMTKRTIVDCCSRGGQLLREACEDRRTNILEVTASLRSLSSLRMAVAKMRYTAKQLNTWKHTKRHAYQAAWALVDDSAIAEGDAYARAGKYNRAVEAYMGSGDSTSDVLLFIKKLIRSGIAYSLNDEPARAAVSFDRALAGCLELEEYLDLLESTATSQTKRCEAEKVLADALRVDMREVDNESLTSSARAMIGICRAHASLGLGQSTMQLGQFDEARVALERSATLFKDIVGDPLKEAESRTLLSQAGAHHKDAPLLTAASSSKKLAHDKLTALEAIVHMSSAQQGAVIELVRESACALRLRREQHALSGQIEELKHAGVEQCRATRRISELLQRINEELKEVKASDKDEMSSSLVHGRRQVFEIEELKVRLLERHVEVKRELESSEQAQRAIEIKISNCNDQIAECDAEHLVETGELMRAVTVKTCIFHHVALNAANVVGNDVRGDATNGVPKLCASSGRNVSVFDLKTGKVERIFEGAHTTHRREDDLSPGHAGLVSALYFFGNTVYSGGMDAVVLVRNISNDTATLVLRGHEATVTSVCATDSVKIVTGAADTKIRVWSASCGECLKVLHGHARSVVALECGSSWLVSGCADGEARLWSLPHEADPSRALSSDIALTQAHAALKSKHVTCQRILRTDSTGLTTVRFGSLELVGGLRDGSIVVWWLASGELVLRTRPHSRGPVFDLQFDATRLVTAGGDGLVVITDLVSGDTLQTLRGHKGPAIAVAFDTDTILSAGVDNTLREWHWTDRCQSSAPKASVRKDKYHIYEASDTLAGIAKRYNIGVADIVRWNALHDDLRALSVGARLVVAKADPSRPTAAEARAKFVAEQRRRHSTAKQHRVAGGLAVTKKSSALMIDDFHAVSRSSLKSRFHLDPASASGRIAKATDITSLDADRVAARHKLLLGAGTHRFGWRLLTAIDDSIDRFSKVAPERSDLAKAPAEAERLNHKCDTEARADKTPNQARIGQLDVTATAALVLDFVFSALVDDQAEAIATDALRSRLWRETLAGRLLPHDASARNKSKKTSDGQSSRSYDQEAAAGGLSAFRGRFEPLDDRDMVAASPVTKEEVRSFRPKADLIERPGNLHRNATHVSHTHIKRTRRHQHDGEALSKTSAPSHASAAISGRRQIHDTCKVAATACTMPPLSDPPMHRAAGLRAPPSRQQRRHGQATALLMAPQPAPGIFPSRKGGGAQVL